MKHAFISFLAGLASATLAFYLGAPHSGNILLLGMGLGVLALAVGVYFVGARKTARVLLAFSDSIEKESTTVTTRPVLVKEPGVFEEVVSALKGQGMPGREARDRVKAAMKHSGSDDFDTLFRLCLKRAS